LRIEQLEDRRQSIAVYRLLDENERHHCRRHWLHEAIATAAHGEAINFAASPTAAAQQS
jgi:hypothetical protein